MDANTRDEMISQYIDQAITDLIPHGAGVVHEHRLRHILQRIAQQAGQTIKTYELLNLVDSAELEQLWGVSRRRVNAHCAALHERWGVGRKVGGAWLLTADEAERHTPGPGGRPRKPTA